MNKILPMILFLIALVLTVFSFYLIRHDSFEISRNTNIGKLIFPDYKIDNISVLELIKPSNKQSVILQKTGNSWVVKTLYNYPADLMQVSNLLKGLALAKVIQNIFVQKADYGALNLLPPSGDESDTSGRGVEIRLLDSNGKLLYSLLAGKKRIEKDASGENRFPLGQYVSPEGNVGVIFTDSLFYEADYDNKEWLDKSFVDIQENKISEIKMLKNGILQWKLHRENYDAAFYLTNLPQEKILDSSIVLKLLEDLKNLKFDSITQLAALNEKLIFEGPTTLVLKFFNGDGYEFSISKAAENDYYYVRVIPMVIGKGEEKDRYSHWIYLIARNRIEELLLNKNNFLRVNKTSKKSGIYSWPVPQKSPLIS